MNKKFCIFIWILNVFLWGHIIYRVGYDRGFKNSKTQFFEQFNAWQKIYPVYVGENGLLAHSKNIDDDKTGVILYQLYEKVRFVTEEEGIDYKGNMPKDNLS